MGQVVKDILKCTYDDTEARDTNYGGDTVVKIRDGTGKGVGVEWGWFEVDLSGEGIPANAIVQPDSKAEFYIEALWDSGEVTYTITRIADAWNEEDPDGLTYNNRPAGSFPLFGGILAPDAADAYWAITGASLAAQIQDALDNRSGLLGFVLNVAPAGDGLICHSDEGDNKPKVTINWLVPHVQVSHIG